ncbi:hypothetical protein LX15_005802 [Streptoalloteichus tenebrarius]|uniref:Uncharacterized protein n=1 Tax=Streptoalloteichus tenebrarius (strain ATCC 17920 / DSM 40477 / JCM 4838 / CBS 697.72 / NBRC 16177 / NCIMB 11028 / NRRL B-12390 / A12253. 1 / ISP 5477) TaxID=1933 RepID=A0ABT1I3B8_STRSD|nr:hypothetical protein [Streptoalloteichus tenebrarius]MCP2262070.1 hypothetical protein [Streptoalloteichus tenebrarius]
MDGPSLEYGETELSRRTVLTALGLAAGAVVVGVLTMAALPKVRDATPARAGIVVPVRGVGANAPAARSDADAGTAASDGERAVPPSTSPATLAPAPTRVDPPRRPRGEREASDRHRERDHDRDHGRHGRDRDDD